MAAEDNVIQHKPYRRSDMNKLRSMASAAGKAIGGAYNRAKSALGIGRNAGKAKGSGS